MPSDKPGAELLTDDELTRVWDDVERLAVEQVRGVRSDVFAVVAELRAARERIAELEQLVAQMKTDAQDACRRNRMVR